MKRGQRVSLRSVQQAAPKVDLESRVIRGASLLTSGEVLGRDWLADETTVDGVVEHLSGKPGHWTHHVFGDSLGQFLGRWQNLRKVSLSDDGPHMALGDFHFSPVADSVQPEGLNVPAPKFLMDLATHEPQEFGVSVVMQMGFENQKLSDGTKVTLGRVVAGERGDFVGDPAANPNGLFGSAELAAMRVGKDTVIAALSALREGIMAEDKAPQFVPKADDDEEEEDPKGLIGKAEENGFSLDQIGEATGAHQTLVARIKAGEVTELPLGFLEKLKGMLAEDDEEEDVPAPKEPEPEEESMSKESLSALKQQIAAQQATIEALQASEKVREDKIDAEYLSSIKQEACAAGSPIPEADLVNVTEALSRRDKVTAHALGDAYVTRAKALGAGSLAGGPKTQTLMLGAHDQHEHDEDMQAFRSRWNLNKQEAH